MCRTVAFIVYNETTLSWRATLSQDFIEVHMILAKLLELFFF